MRRGFSTPSSLNQANFDFPAILKVQTRREFVEETLPQISKAAKSNPSTPYPKPHTLKPNPQTPNSKPKTLDLKPRILNVRP